MFNFKRVNGRKEIKNNKLIIEAENEDQAIEILINQYDNSAYSSKLDPERGVYYVFPGYLDHFVTRNMSDQLRVSLSINFKKDEWDYI